ncbi:MAG TPA: AIPR family protein [Candidatus Acidoferrum sp.]|nr:AIPR family protein [Candidatus Acidoferrum sp.]
MKNAAQKAAREAVPFPYHSFRNISCPEDLENNRKVFSGHAPVTSVLPLNTDENVRAYLLEAEGKQRRRETQVNREIRETLESNPESFSILNTGVVIVAHGHEVDEQKKLLLLTKPSIINGAQTQGVLSDYFSKLGETGEAPPNIHVKYELIVTDDDELIAEISIARNFQNDVANISIAGRRGQLDELEKSLQDKLPEAKLRKSETELSEDYISMERLLQVITALIPASLWPKSAESENPKKVYTYSMKAKCLKEFIEIHRKAHDKKDPEHEKAKALFQFYLDIAAEAYQLYEKWKVHQGFKGTGIRSITRENREIVEVPDGIIFPILASLSAFAKKTSQGWTIKPPKMFGDDELIRAAKSVYQNIAMSNPWIMGKNQACYAALFQITSIYQKLSA